MDEQRSIFEKVFERFSDGVLLTGNDGTVLGANPAACRALGRTEDEIRHVGRRGLVVEDANVGNWGERRGAAAGELTFRRPDGSTLPVEFTSGLIPSADGGLPYVIFRDISERRRMEATVRRIGRALRLRTACNEVLVRATVEEALLSEVCAAMVHIGGYRMCWVGIPMGDARKTVRPVAHAGHEDGYLAVVDVVWSEEARGRGPTGTALRTCVPVVNRDFQADDAVAPWKEEATKRGYRTSTALPLIYEGQKLGVLTMYASDLEVFDEEELAILAGLSGDVAYGLHTLRERAARARAERAREEALRALAAERHMLSESQRIAHIGTWSWDVASNAIRWSDEAYRIWGVPPSASPLTLTSILERLHPGDLEAMTDRIRAAVSGTLAPDVGREFEVEFRIVRPDREIRTLYTLGTVHQDAEGRAIDAVGTVQDVTDRKREEADRERLATAIEQAAEAVVVTDAHGIIVYANPAVETVSGYSRAELVGKNPRILKSGVHDGGHYRALWQTIRSGKTWRGRMVNQRKDGAQYTVDATISPVRDPTGIISSYVAVERDITRDLSLEAQLLQSQKMEGIGRLAGGVAHDFNNLLSVILSYAKFALDAVPDKDPLHDDLLEIAKAGQRAASLTRQLLAFSRKQVLQPVPVDLNQILTEMEKMFRRILGEDIQLLQVLPADLWVVMADPGQLETVVMNLVVNARDAMPEGGRLTIQTENTVFDAEYAAVHEDVTPGQYVMLAVSDSGTGMDEPTRARIFEPFFTTKGLSGTGLGLSTIYGIVKQSGGSIFVYSEPGEGTTFKIYFPRRLSRSIRVTRAPPSATHSAAVETILVVEDDEAVRGVARRILHGAGYTVLTASNGSDALRLCEEHSEEIHLVLTDVVMPLMGGKVLAERLASVRPGVKVLYMSGFTNDTIVHHGVLDPDTYFIGKPLTQVELLQKVRDVLDESPMVTSR